MAFLCTKHRNELSNHPIKALSKWQDWMRTGCEYLKHKDTKGALNYFGCAFEVSEILLNQPCGFLETQVKRIDRFMFSGFYLAEVYQRQSQKDVESQILRHLFNKLSGMAEKDEILAKRIDANIEFLILMLEENNAKKFTEDLGHIYHLPVKHSKTSTMTVH